MVKLLSIISLILAIVFFPPAVLAVISNNAVPGDSTYPIKRSLEDVIFAIASVNPTTKAWFSAARSDRRFKELSVLITQGKQAGETLNELVEQTEVAASQIAQVSNQIQKQQLVEQLTQSIEKYDQGLQQFTDAPQTSLPKATNLPTITSTTPRGVVSPTIPPQTALTPMPTPIPTLAPVPLPQTSTPTAQPTPSPKRENEEGRQRHEEREFPSEIEEARKKLEEIKRKLHQKSSEERKEKLEDSDDRNKDENKVSKDDQLNRSKQKGESSKEE